MNYGTKELTEFLNNLNETKKDVDYKNKINNIVSYLVSMDIVNGENYLKQIIEDEDIEKNLKYRQTSNTYGYLTKQMSIEESFIQDCLAVIIAISITMLEEKVKDEYKNHTRPELRSLIDTVQRKLHRKLLYLFFRFFF